MCSNIIRGSIQSFFETFCKNTISPHPFLDNSECKVNFISLFLPNIVFSFYRKISSFLEKIIQDRGESSMIHSASPQSRPAVRICFVLVDFEKWERTYVLTTCVNIVITNYRLWLWSASWINRFFFCRLPTYSNKFTVYEA